MKLIYSQIKNIACLVLVFGAIQTISAQCPAGQTQVCVEYGSGSFNGENSWLLWDATAGTDIACDDAPSVPGTYTACATNGNTLELYAFETFGDNWNGATLSLSICENGSANGCDAQSSLLYGPDGNPGGADGNGSLNSCPGGTPFDQGGGALAFTLPGGTQCLMCSTCADDITVNNDPGECGATLPIEYPIISPDCTLDGITACTTIDGPTTPLNFSGTLIATPFSVSGVGTVPTSATCVNEICFTITHTGDFDFSPIEDGVILDENGQFFGITNTAAGQCATGEAVICVPVSTYNGYAADGVINFTLQANTAVNDICASSSIQASVDYCFDCVNFSNSLTGDDAEEAFFPVGTTTLNIAFSVDGSPASCSYDVTVIDAEGPTMICPLDQTISLDAGECDDIFYYDVVVLDNCPSTPFTINGPFCDNENPTGGSALACSGGSNSIIQGIDVSGLSSPVVIDQMCFNQESFGTSTTMTINLFCDDGSGNVPYAAGGFTPIASQTQAVSNANNGNVVCVTFDIPATIDASCGTLWVEVFTPSGRVVQTPATCASNGQSATGTNTYIVGPLCGLNMPTPFNSIGFALDATFDVLAIPGEIEAIPDPTNQWVSGDNLPIGENCFRYTAADNAGNATECEWCVTINEFPEELQSSALTCNDLVNISVDQSCSAVVTADDILEGGPYGCYDTYNVLLEIVPASAVSNNGSAAVSINAQAIPAFAANGMAGTYKASVIDPDNNNNSCWGYIMLEDKLAPTITCEDVTISCINSAAPAEPTNGVIGFTNDDPGLQWADGTTGDIGSVSGSVSAPAGAKITDLSVTLKMDHSWVGDLDVVLTGPDGTEVAILDGSCSINDNVNATFSYNATTPISCAACASTGPHENCTDPAQYETCATVSQFVLPVGDMGVFDGTNPNGTWSLSFTDNVGGDGGCVREVSVEVAYTVGAATPAVAMDNCTPVDPVYSDVIEDRDCETGIDQIITRSWIASDAKGNTSDICVQTITVEAITLGDIPLPPSIVDLPCGHDDVSPAGIAAYYDDPNTRDVNGTPIIENNEGIPFAYPHYFAAGHPQAIPDAGLCGVYAEYKDHVIDACGAHCHGNKKILRTWKLLNWCTQNFAEYTQIIRAKDLEAPTFILKDTMVSTRPWDCTGEFMVPEPWELHDNCDIDPYYTVVGPPGVIITPKPGGGWIASGAPKGVHTFTYTAWDCCGNSRSQTAQIAVLDKVAPVVTTKRDIVVSLTPGGLVDTAALAKLYCPNIDNGSYDFCTPVVCEIRRPSGAPQCDNVGINGHNNNTTFNNTDTRFQSGNHPDDNRNDTDNGEYVKFCCEDITAVEGDANEDGMVDDLDAGYVKVIIRVWDDANMSGVYGDEVAPFPGMMPQKDNYNEGWAWVKVECKSIPVISCPPADTVKCYWDVKFDPGAGWRKVSEVDLSKSGFATAYGCCGSVEVEFSDAGNLQECQEGTFVRTFRAGYTSIDGQQLYVQCQQRITVLRDDYEVTVTPKNRDFPNPSCTFDEGIIDQARPTINGGPCDVIGENVTVDTFLFENGVCKKWRITYEYWNWCKQEAYGPFYEYAIYEDTDDPVIMTCQDTMIGVDANCQAVVTLTNAAYDVSECTDDEWIKWVVEIDLWADGTIDAVAATHYTQRNWTPVSDPWYGDIQVINLPGTASKDSVNQPMDQLSGDQIATVTFPEIVEGKMSNHKVTWKAIDGCHNESGCSYNVMVADKKAPTPYCINISSAVMQDGTVELWAIDFNVGSFDNCTPQEDLLYTFNEMAGAFDDTVISSGGRNYLVNADIPQFFDENGFAGFDGDGVITDANGNIIPTATASNLAKYAQGDLQRWKPAYRSSAKVFDCDEYNTQGPNGAIVRMTVWDKKFNSDFCVVYLSLVDNQGGCDPNNPRIAGSVVTTTNDDLDNVQVTVEGDVNDITQVQVVDGAFSFTVPANVNYELTAVKDVDYMNGVSTLDLVMIQRHILGLAELDNEYKLISADVNNDMSIRANDLVELRKLILGVTNDFTATSWKIVNASETIPMTTPLEYSEVVYIDNLQSDFNNANFIATKVGDVSGDAKANARSLATENRSARTITLVADEQAVVAGQTVEVAVTGANFNQVYGYQFTSNLNGLTLAGVRPGAIEMTDANIGLPQADVMTASWASEELATAVEGEVLFTLEFVATASGNLSDMININSNVTKAESYTGVNMEVSNIELAFRTETSETANYELYQNEPNPFKDVTTVTYEMAEAGDATFTLYDVTGKVLVVENVKADKGLNTIEFRAGDINTTGIVYYQIESGDFTATRKMIIIK